MDYQKAVDRLKTLKGHLFPAHLIDGEIGKATFKLDEIQKLMWEVIPNEYFEGYEIASELKSLE